MPSIVLAPRKLAIQQALIHSRHLRNVVILLDSQVFGA